MKETTLPTIEWEDTWGCKHTATLEWATKTLKKLYNEYPGGLEEIEASIRSWSNYAKDLERINASLKQKVEQRGYVKE